MMNRERSLTRITAALVVLSVACAHAAYGLQQKVVRLEGYVFDGNSERPLSNVVVDVMGRKARTDIAGKFTFTDLTPGMHLLIAEKDGYGRARASAGAVPGTPGITLTLENGAVSTVSIRMFPAGSVSGTVVDLSGKPIRGMTVAPYRYTYDRHGRRTLTRVGISHFVSAAETTPALLGPQYKALDDPRYTNVIRAVSDDRGEFRLINLDPGEYLFSIASLDGFVNQQFMQTFYPGVPDPMSARTVSVKGGEGVRLGVIGMSPASGGFLRARVVNETGDDAAQIVMLQVRRAGATEPLTGLRLAKGQVGQVASLSPGSYEVEAYIGRGAIPFSGAARAAVAMDGRDVDLEIRVPKAARLTGTSIPGTEFTFASSEMVPNLNFPVRTKSDGTLEGYAPTGLFYMTSATGSPAGRCLGELLSGDRNVLKDGLLVEGTEVTITAVFTEAQDVVRGSVLDSSGAPVPGGVVALVPVDRSHTDLYASARTDQNGNFAISCVKPSGYTAYAWRELDGGAFRNADFMRTYDDRGIAVTREQLGGAPLTLRVLEP